jgi:hypothetical protein
VGPRALVGTAYMADPSLREEYARDIAPRTTAALAKILGPLFPEPSSFPGKLRVLDLGAGTGAAGQAVRERFASRVEVVSVDRVAGGAGTLVGDVADVGRLSRQLGGQRFELIVAAHVLNELEPERQSSDRPHRLARLVESWGDTLLSDGGTLIVLEPALRETSRVLLGVRDLLLTNRALRIVAPCLFAGPCPALARERDWCHDAAGTVDFSYLVLRGGGLATTPVDPALFRIVSDPMPEKGRLRLFGCGAAGRHALVRLHRHRSAGNADFDGLARGDLAHLTPTDAAADGLRVTDQTTVTRR